VVSDVAESDRPLSAHRRDAVRNYHRILEAACEVLGESGADAGMEEVAARARAGVGVGTVYRRFANKDALIDELLRLDLVEAVAVARLALDGPGGEGLEQLLRGFGALFARRGLTQVTAEVAPGSWPRFLDFHLAGLRAAGQ
jgi:AcrR family transcriptional regulator